MAQLRRLADEPSTATYSDDLLVAYLQRYPVYALHRHGHDADVYGNGWLPGQIRQPATWDVKRAAADIWEEKAATLAKSFDFVADGGNFSRSQAHDHALKMARELRQGRRQRSMRAVGIDRGLDCRLGEDQDDDCYL